jgi:hypothetical protein
MDLDNYKFRYDAYKNNTFDLDVVELSLDESKMSAYKYLRQFQLDSTGYKRFDFKMQDIYKTNVINHTTTYIPRKWVFFIEYEFINVGKRLDYRRSELFEKEISYNDIINRSDLFDSTFLVFINGCLYTKGIKLLCKEDKTFVILYCNEDPVDEGFSITEMHNYIENNADVSILMIPNTGIKTIRTNAYRAKTLNKSTGIPNRNLNLVDEVDYSNSLAYIKYINSISSIPTSISLTETGMYINDIALENAIQTNPNNTIIDVQLIPLRNLLTKINIEQGDKWFSIPIQDYPVAIENCLVFDSDGMFLHKAKVVHYYPNIYCVEGVDDIISETGLEIYVFYYENIYNKLKHINMLEVYHKYMPDLLEKYADGSVNERVKNFEPPEVDYTIKNFNISEHYDDHFKYKIAKMKEFIAADVNNFRRYLRNLGLGNNYYYVDISKIDLNTRIRTDNKDTKLEYKSFNEDMFMFVFRNDFRSMYDKLIVHVDGIRYETIELFKTEMLDYLYIPCKLIRPDSILEIEKISQVMKEYKLNSSDTTDIISIDIGEYAVRNKTLYNDLFIIDRNTREIVNPEAYQLILPIKINVDDRKENIILDYLISETNNSYYYLKGIEEGYVQLVKQPYYMVEKNAAANRMRVKDDITSTVYQLDIDDDDDVDLKELKRSSHVISCIKSNDNMDINYQLKVIDGKVKIQVIPMNESDITGNIAYGGLDLINLGEVFLECPRDIKIRIVDENYLNRDLLLMIKKNFKFENITKSRGHQYLKTEGEGIFKLYIDDEKLTSDNYTKDSISSDCFYIRDAVTKEIYKIYIENDRLYTEPVDYNVECEPILAVYDDNLIKYNLTTHDGVIQTNLASVLSEYMTFASSTKPDSRYFRMYRNGRLVPRHAGIYNPRLFHKGSRYYDITVLPGFKIQPNDEVFIECMPYMMNQVCYLESIPKDKVVDLTGKIDKPFDFKWFDVYLNGRKLAKREVEIISANKIKILKTDSLRWLEIVENSRDKEYFGCDYVYDIIDELFDLDTEFADNVNNSIDIENMKDIEEPVIDRVISFLDYLLDHLYNYLCEMFGMFNPDELQITQEMLNWYDGLMFEDIPFELNPDVFGEIGAEIKLTINPDED